MNTNKTSNSRNAIIATAVIALLIGSGAGYWIASGKSADNKPSAMAEKQPLFYRNAMNPAITSPKPAKDEMGMDYVPVYAEESSPPAERKPLFYRNPMNPEVTSPVPAQDEMGMDYVPVYPEAGGATQTGTVKIDATVVQDIGVRTTKVTRAVLSRDIRTIGRVTYDEQRVARLHPKYDGWVEKLFIDKTGEQIKQGSMLLSIYSPQLVATQEEYLLALDSVAELRNSPFADVRNGAVSLLRSAKQRLQLLDVPEHQIAQLNKTHKIMKGIHIHSPFDGVVMNIGAREGERITPASELYMITDLSRVWVIVDIYEDDMPWVRKGDTANIQVAAIPGRTFTGKVAYIYPYMEAKTRTIKVRIELDNAKLELKPEMFANVNIASDKQITALVVPSEAIVRTGTQEQVFVQRAPGQFEPRKVVVGVATNGQTQIVSGLNEGEVVVTSSQFLIDSESKLKEATAKMMEAGKSKPAATPEPAMQPEPVMPAPEKMPGMDMPKKALSGHEHMEMPSMEGMGDMKSMNGGAQQ
jgi:Cu(I)/Ag(I) efflux system membrane fusion protein